MFRAVESFSGWHIPPNLYLLLGAYFFFIYTPLLAIGSAIPKDDCTQSSFESEILFWGGSITLFTLLC